ncbi:hypothetical protein [Streptomyces sp. NPDC101234]|uniref:hypothetical protein n=1 Tax=Streptomyces sp. NPDC101234 TaxID=3366138 RepID=UPI00381FC001
MEPGKRPLGGEAGDVQGGRQRIAHIDSRLRSAGGCGELGDLAPALDSGVTYGCGADGQVSGATRADLAAAAAVALTGQGQPGNAYGPEGNSRVYELGGTPFTLADIAAEVSRQSGRPLVYQDLSADQYAQALAAQGVPQAFADLLADTSLAIARGDWYTPRTDLERLIGRPATPPADVVAAQLRALRPEHSHAGRALRNHQKTYGIYDALRHISPAKMRHEPPGS